jgi:hypothetical protein
VGSFLPSEQLDSVSLLTKDAFRVSYCLLTGALVHRSFAALGRRLPGSGHRREFSVPAAKRAMS